jgi:hypothetical protein
MGCPAYLWDIMSSHWNGGAFCRRGIIRGLVVKAPSTKQDHPAAVIYDRVSNSVFYTLTRSYAKGGALLRRSSHDGIPGKIDSMGCPVIGTEERFVVEASFVILSHRSVVMRHPKVNHNVN